MRNAITGFGPVLSDAHAAFQRAASSGSSFRIPRGVYTLSDTVQLSNQTGQRVVCDGPYLFPDQGQVKIIAPPGKPAFAFGAPYQGFHYGSIQGDMSAGQCGIHIGPGYVYGFSILGSSFHNLKIGTRNETVGVEGIDGSDCGGIRDCLYHTCEDGHYSFNNRDQTIFHGNSASNCKRAVHVVGGGIDLRGGVYGENESSIKFSDGAWGDVSAAFFEGFQPTSSTAHIHLAGNNRVNIGKCFMQVHEADPVLPFCQVDAGSVARSNGNEGLKFFVNSSSSQVFGNGEEVNFQGMFTARAGSYFLASSNPATWPTASSEMRGRTILAVDPTGALPDRLLRCLNTGTGYAWL